MAKTKKPTGLSITRDGNRYTFKWKIADDNYGDGQKLQYRTQGSKSWRDWQTVSIGSTTTSKTVTISKSDFYPNTGSYLMGVEFRVNGNRSSYTKDGKTINPDVSDWSEKVMSIALPSNPSVSASLSSSNVCVFSWNISSSDSDKKIYTSYEWQSILVAESTVTDGSELKWSSSASGYQTATGTSASGTKSITEDTSTIASGSHTRWFRVRAKGTAGHTDWKYAKHVYAKPKTPVIKDFTTTAKATGYLVDLTWTATANSAYPIDETTVFYAFGVPRQNMQPPASPSWQEADISKDTSGTDRAVFLTSGLLDEDECLFVKVKVVHDARETESEIKLIRKGVLSDPSGLSVSVSNRTATVSVTNNSSASTYTGSDTSIKRLFTLISYKGEQNYKQPIQIGVVPYGSSSASITLPDTPNETSYSISARAVVGTFSYTTMSDNSRRYTVEPEMRSSEIWSNQAMPKAPKNVTAIYDGRVIITWDWTWENATSAEISWAEKEDAWESTETPETFVIDHEATRWILDGLSAGTKYYIRVRLINDDTYSPYSDTAEITLTLPPVTPVLVLSDGTITQDGRFTASWAYSSPDGTEQEYAEIVYNSTIIGHTENANYITFYAKDLGWTAGTYALKVRVKSASGSYSEYSDEVSIQVVAPLTASISQTSLTNVTVTDDTSVTRSVLSLTAMPLTVTVTGAGSGGGTVLAIERAESYHIERPDENTDYGYEGETIFLLNQVGEAQISVTTENIMGRFDDGAKYRLVATVKDGLGQTDTVTRDFEIHWSRKALMPTGTVTISGTTARITPTAQNAISSDYCDIYRLSADKPELIAPKASFGTTYVDPYPAINGGYRIVFCTANGDYITSSNQPAWADIESGFDYEKAIIEFGTDKVELYYNVDASHNWSKDFIETKYLGGSVQGDWNPAISRSATITGITLNLSDQDTINAMRRLAVWSGLCNVRTKDGSSFHANVDVSESNSHERYGLLTEFSLTITRVDPQGYDGIPVGVWSE